MKRHKLSKGHSRHMFSKHASKTHRKNVQGHGYGHGPMSMPMRGGIRL